MSRTVLFTGDIFRLQERGGITRYFTELIPRLRRPSRILAGLHQSAVIRDRGIPAEAALYMPAFRLSPRPRATFNEWIDARRILRDPGDILHPTYYRDPAKLPALPLVLTVYDMAHERFPALFRRHWWNSDDPARWKAAVVGRADRIVCISESTKRDLLAILGPDERKTRVIHLGTKDWSSVTTEELPSVREPFFLWIGERHTYKNFMATLIAWGTSEAVGSTSILCVGGGAFRPDEREAVVKLGAKDRVRHMTLSDSQLKWAYQNALALLYTSQCEGFGLPIVEAMALECPVVASGTSSMPEVAGDAATYVDPTDTDSIRTGLEQVLALGRDDALRARLRNRAAVFSWERCAEAHEALYRELD
jgi:glycosyltransferase involved in cell wall biosynthesis